MVPSDPVSLPLNKSSPVQADIVPVLSAQQLSQRYLDEAMNSRHANPLMYQLNELVDSAPKIGKRAGPQYYGKAGRDSMGDLLSGGSSNDNFAVRSSTRLNSKYIGGKSQISLGDDSVDMFASADNEPARHHHVDQRRYETHFHIGQVSESMADTVKLDNTEFEKLNAKGRHHYPGANKSSFGLLSHDSTVTGVDKSLPHDSPQKNKQTFSIWESSSNGQVMQSRPSSRVLNVPGGRSSIQFY